MGPYSFGQARRSRSLPGPPAWGTPVGLQPGSATWVQVSPARPSPGGSMPGRPSSKNPTSRNVKTRDHDPPPRGTRDGSLRLSPRRHLLRPGQQVLQRLTRLAAGDRVSPHHRGPSAGRSLPAHDDYQVVPSVGDGRDACGGPVAPADPCPHLRASVAGPLDRLRPVRRRRESAGVILRGPTARCADR